MYSVAESDEKCGMADYSPVAKASHEHYGEAVGRAFPISAIQVFLIIFQLDILLFPKQLQSIQACCRMNDDMLHDTRAD